MSEGTHRLPEVRSGHAQPAHAPPAEGIPGHIQGEARTQGSGTAAVLPAHGEAAREPEAARAREADRPRDGNGGEGAVTVRAYARPAGGARHDNCGTEREEAVPRAAARRCRMRQDRRRDARNDGRMRRWFKRRRGWDARAMRADGAHGHSRAAALQVIEAVLRRRGPERATAGRRHARRRTQGDSGRTPDGACRRGHRHARPVQQGRFLFPARLRHHRRTAPIWCGPARSIAREGRLPRHARDERDTDSAKPRHDALW